MVQKTKIIIFCAIIISIILGSAYVFNPVYSPLAEIHDKDGDGHPDATDEYPDNPLEWKDSDLDSYGDNSDAFPNDRIEWNDTDNDGYGDNSDVFPDNPNEWNDTDNDGYGDNKDAFPEDESEWSNLDWDSIGDNSDFYDHGNGGIKISIIDYTGDIQADNGLSHADSYFVICVDVNRDGIFEYNKITSIHTNESSYTLDPDDEFIVDVLDNTTALDFRIIVYDANETVRTSNDIMIDYTNDTSSKYFTHTVLSPFNQTWEQDGMADSQPALFNNEVDCILKYRIEAIEYIYPPTR